MNYLYQKTSDGCLEHIATEKIGCMMWFPSIGDSLYIDETLVAKAMERKWELGFFLQRLRVVLTEGHSLWSRIKTMLMRPPFLHSWSNFFPYGFNSAVWTRALCVPDMTKELFPYSSFLEQLIWPIRFRKTFCCVIKMGNKV